jgi:hypothetical protein
MDQLKKKQMVPKIKFFTFFPHLIFVLLRFSRFIAAHNFTSTFFHTTTKLPSPSPAPNPFWLPPPLPE